MDRLHTHARAGHVVDLRLALREVAKAEVSKLDEDGVTPLHLAATEGHKACVTVLLQAGAEIDKCDPGGWTPLHYAIVEGHEDIVDCLLDEGADTSIRADLSDDCRNCDALKMAEVQGEYMIAGLIREANVHKRRAAEKLARPPPTNHIPAAVAWLFGIFILCVHVGMVLRLLTMRH